MSLVLNRVVWQSVAHVAPALELQHKEFLKQCAHQAVSQCCVFEFDLYQTWQEIPSTVRLVVCYFMAGAQGILDAASLCVVEVLHASQNLQKLRDARDTSETGSRDRLNDLFDPDAGSRFFRAFAKATGGKVFHLHEPLELCPLSIPKPWGREIWYTGAEKRGVCNVAQGDVSMALPWLWHAGAGLLSGHFAPHVLEHDAGQSSENKNALLLLKILDPLPDSVFGDLYFELHKQKWEIYVVSSVDARAWPTGRGQLRFGISPQKFSEFKNDVELFKLAFKGAVLAYERVRRSVDALLDEKRTTAGVALNQPVAPAQMQAWTQELCAERPEFQKLHEQELSLRAEMESFTGVRELSVGDVVRVPIHVPHALQHGVRVVEFQTPTYERLVVSFAQKVLTQNHWDIDEAFELMDLRTPQPDTLELEHPAGHSGIAAERIVDFPQFTASRISLNHGVYFKENAGASYVLLYSLSAGLSIKMGDTIIPFYPERALLVPAHQAYEVHYLAPTDAPGQAPVQGVYLRARPA